MRLLNGASKSDDRGWSLADHFLGTNEGGPAGCGSPMPVGAAGVKAQQALRKRQKESYGALANCGECEGGEAAYLFDADDQASVELAPSRLRRDRWWDRTVLAGLRRIFMLCYVMC